MDVGSVEPGKIFVGGLSWQTTKESLKAHFEKFGKVADCVIMIDPLTRRPRGFGFVTFSDPSCVSEVMKTQDHIIDTKKVDPKPATLKNETPGPASVIKKVFVGGIEANTTKEMMKEYFSQFGTVTDVDLKYDKTTQRMRGFGFVGFESEEAVEQVCQTHFHQINGKTVEVKKAEPRYATASAEAFRAGMPSSGGMNYGGSNFGGYSGRGGGNSGYSSYPTAYGYGYGGGQQQQQGYGYAGYSSGYGNQSTFGQYGQGGTYATGADRGYYSAQQAGTANQQQMSYGQDSSAYGRTGYTGTDGYSGGAHSTTAYTYDNQAAASFPQYDNQAAGYGRGMGQQRGVSSYQQPYGSH